MTEYKLERQLKWDSDVLHVKDVVKTIKDDMSKQFEEFVLDHFEADMSDFREYMHDKIKWERKQELVMPRWISVTERLPEKGATVLALFDRPDVKNIMHRVWVLHNVNVDSDIEVAWRDGRIVAWCPIPEPPKEDDDPKEDEDVSL